MSSDSTAQPGSEEQGQILLRIARGSLVEAFGGCGWQAPQNHRESWLAAHRATFVTLLQEDRLRGCIGTLRAYRSLLEDVHENARAAAFNDSRFPSMVAAEVSETQIEVSLLSPPENLPFLSEDDLRQALRPGLDGVILEYEEYRGTFLPQVWERLTEPADFLAHLKEKAGLSRGFWNPEIRVSRYTVQSWEEPEDSARPS